MYSWFNRTVLIELLKCSFCPDVLMKYLRLHLVIRKFLHGIVIVIIVGSVIQCSAHKASSLILRNSHSSISVNESLSEAVLTDLAASMADYSIHQTTFQFLTNHQQEKCMFWRHWRNYLQSSWPGLVFSPLPMVKKITMHFNKDERLTRWLKMCRSNVIKQ